MLLALQCHERGIVPERVAGFRTWLKLGRYVRRGEKALRILAPVCVKERDAAGEQTGEWRVFFKTAFVFELSQTEPHVAVRLAFPARTATLRLQASWPWARDLAAAFARLKALPAPAR